MKRAFAERLKELRKEQNLTIEQLSELVGISTATISRYENGLQDATGDIIIVLSDFFKVSPNYLLGKED